MKDIAISNRTRILSPETIKDMEAISNLVSNYFGIGHYTELQAQCRSGNCMWAMRFISLFTKVILNLTQKERGELLNRDHATVRVHEINVIYFIRNRDKLTLIYFNDLLQILSQNEYPIAGIRKYIDEYRGQYYYKQLLYRPVAI